MYLRLIILHAIGTWDVLVSHCDLFCGDCPRLRTVGLCVRQYGHFRFRIEAKCPWLRTFRWCVRNHGHLRAKLYGKRPQLRTVGQGVRNCGRIRLLSVDPYVV